MNNHKCLNYGIFKNLLIQKVIWIVRHVNISSQNMNETINVVKRDGAKEPYLEDKVTRVAQAAGLRPIDADQLAKKITEWVDGTGLSEVTSLQIRDKVFEELEKMDKYASGLYAWYQNIKDKKYTSNK